MKRLISILFVFIVALAVSSCSPEENPQSGTATPLAESVAWPTPVTYVGSGIFFDDFNYSGPDDPALEERGWIVRTTPGGPGVPGAQWLAEGVSFLDDADMPGNRLAQLSSSTAGQPENTAQAELFHQRKFYQGTYASRVRFTDTPLFGPDGDHIVETFFTITPLNYPLDPDYGEVDFEYLPNGGWGVSRNTLYMTTWETYQVDPWEAVSIHNNIPLSFDGWHTLVVQVAGGKIRYFIDGSLLAEHGDQFFPETPMSINYNLWFISDGLVNSPEERRYIQQMDWLYYAGYEVLSPAEVEERVTSLRAAQIAHLDQVPDWTAPPVVIPPTPTPSVAGPRPFEADIPKVSGIQVDGQLDDWFSDPTFTLDERDQVVYLAGGAKWNGPEDLSARAWVGWDDDGLYMAFDIIDDLIVQQGSSTDIWQGDYVEVQLDTQFEEDYHDNRLSDDDYQFGFTPGDFGKNPASAYVWEGPVTDSQMALIQQAQTRTATGYILEIFIPRELLPGMSFSAGTTFGLNINPSDSDSPEAPQKLMMSTSSIRLRTDPTTFGKMTLVGD